MKKVVIIALILTFTGMLFVGCTSKPEPISQEVIDFVVGGIEQQAGVVGVAVVQKDNDISLAIVVDYNVGKEQAKELGDNFVRLLVTFSRDYTNKSPGKEIGATKHNYLITVVYSNEEIVVQGAKVSVGTYIRWQ
jgi:hypothetical protein